jgi:hypothetical protein
MFSCAVNASVEDSWQGSTNLAVWMVNQMHGSGKYIGMDAAGWHTLEVRKRAFNEVLRWYKDIKLIGSWHEVDPSDPVNNAYNITKATLRANPDLKGVATTGICRPLCDQGHQRNEGGKAGLRDQHRPGTGSLAEMHQPVALQPLSWALSPLYRGPTRPRPWSLPWDTRP